MGRGKSTVSASDGNLTAGFRAAGVHHRRTVDRGVSAPRAQGSAEGVLSPDMRKLLCDIRSPTTAAAGAARQQLADLLTDTMAMGIGYELDPYFDVLPLGQVGEADNIWDDVRLGNRGAMKVWDPTNGLADLAGILRADGDTEVAVAIELWAMAHANFNRAVAAQAARGLVWEDRSFKWDECQYLLTADAIGRLEGMCTGRHGRPLQSLLSGWGPQTWERTCLAALSLMPATHSYSQVTATQLQEAFESALSRLLNDDAFMRRSAE